MVGIEQYIWLVEFCLAQHIAIGREPVRPFPAKHTPEHRAQILHTVITGRSPQRATRFAFLIRIMHAENLGIGFFVLFDQETPPGIVAKAARVDAHHVDGRFAIDNPVGQLPTRASGGSNPETMAFVKPEVFDAPCRSDNGRTVRRIGDCAVVDFFDADLAKGGHALHRREDIRLKSLQCVGEKFVFAVRRWPVDIAGRRANLIRPKQQASRLFSHIIAGIRFPQHAHFGKSGFLACHDSRMLFSHDILMLDRDYRDIEPDHCASLAREIARARDNMLTRDIALIS